MATEARRTLTRAREAAAHMALISEGEKNRILDAFAARVGERKAELLTANRKDLKAAKGKIAESMYNRLELTDSKVAAVVAMIRAVRDQPDPTGRLLSHLELDTGLEMVKKTVPLGVVVVVFESRPDVVPQVTSLILKSGNAVVFKGGSEARHTNAAFERIWNELGREFPALPARWEQQVGGREEFRSLLKHHDLIDLVIPRGSNRLVSSVMKSTRAPVLGHADGVCSMFIHESADLDQAVDLAVDAKLQAPSTCNAIETLLVQKSVAPEFFKRFADKIKTTSLRLLACPRSRKFLKSAAPAREKDFDTEFGDARLAVKIVDDLDQAVRHINQHGSHHTDAIVARDARASERFFEGVDSATVLSNASTRFADGYRLGLGAEVGVSTSKIHSRGPAGLESLVTTKFVVRGEGHVVSDYLGPSARAFKHRPLDNS